MTSTAGRGGDVVGGGGALRRGAEDRVQPAAERRATAAGRAGRVPRRAVPARRRGRRPVRDAPPDGRRRPLLAQEQARRLEEVGFSFSRRFGTLP